MLHQTTDFETEEKTKESITSRKIAE
jgi:hypothetical protein